MATFLLSDNERDYIISGVREDLRADGRTCTDYRHFTIRTGVVSNTSGSAKVNLVIQSDCTCSMHVVYMHVDIDYVYMCEAVFVCRPTAVQ